MGTEVSYLAAAGAGAFSFLSPCVLPLVPAYLSFMAGTSLEDLKAEDGVDPALERRVVLAAVAFVQRSASSFHKYSVFVFVARGRTWPLTVSGPPRK